MRRAWTEASAARASCNGARAAICSVSSAVNSSVGVKISVRETISDNQTHSEALRGTQWHSEGTQWLSEAIRGKERNPPVNSSVGSFVSDWTCCGVRWQSFVSVP
jgi:hypothetical protein